MSKSAEYAQLVRDAATAACDIIRASERLMPYEAMLKDVITQMQGDDADGRVVAWRARLRLYCERDAYETPVADTDPALPPEREGETHIGGLPAVAAWVRELIYAHHVDEPCSGLTDTAITRKVKGLRTQMSSRGDGSGVMRLPYEVRQGDSTVRMIARVDILRGAAVEERVMPRLSPQR